MIKELFPRCDRALSILSCIIVCYVAVGNVGMALSQDAVNPGPQANPAKLSGKMAYISLSDSIWQVFVLDLDTGNAQQVTKSAIDKRNPTWTADGGKVAYRTTNGKIELVEVGTGAVEDLAPTLGFLVDPKLSPTGKRITFARFDSDPPDIMNVFSYSLSEKKLIRMTDGPAMSYAPAWSPDDSKVAYIHGKGAGKHFLTVMDADGKNVRRLQTERSDDASPAWSPDGQWILFTSSRSGDFEIWRVHPDGSGLEQLTHSPGLDTTPYFAPDGSKIVFTSNRDGQVRLWTMDPDGTNCQPLSAAGILARDPAWWQKGEGAPASPAEKNP